MLSCISAPNCSRRPFWFETSPFRIARLDLTCSSSSWAAHTVRPHAVHRTEKFTTLHLSFYSRDSADLLRFRSPAFRHGLRSEAQTHMCHQHPHVAACPGPEHHDHKPQIPRMRARASTITSIIALGVQGAILGIVKSHAVQAEALPEGSRASASELRRDETADDTDSPGQRLRRDKTADDTTSESESTLSQVQMCSGWAGVRLKRVYVTAK